MQTARGHKGRVDPVQTDMMQPAALVQFANLIAFAGVIRWQI